MSRITNLLCLFCLLTATGCGQPSAPTHPRVESESEPTGSEQAGSEQAGSEQAGSEQAGSEQAGSEQAVAATVKGITEFEAWLANHRGKTAIVDLWALW